MQPSLSPASTNVGTYDQALIRLTGEGAGNYTIAASGNSAGQLVITPKTLTYSIANATGTYGTAARLAAQHASEVEISILEDLCRQYEASLGNEAMLARSNRQFHDTLQRCSHNRYLGRLFDAPR